MKKYNNEREGQIEFFSTFRVDYKNNEVLIDNTDGVYHGNLLEFKLNINDLNKTLFQSIKYLSKLRIKGRSVPANILLISLNEEICYLYNSQDYFEEIHRVYLGEASKNNEGFIAKAEPIKIDYSTYVGAAQLLSILKTDKYMKIQIDENCIVGWAERYYKEFPNANKGDFLGDETGLVKIIGEIRKPKEFKDFILPYKGQSNERFKYLMDKLNDDLKKKDLGAFYTPMPYCKKAAELIRKAIERVPEGNDYVIIDRCAGTGNLEDVLTEEELKHCILSTYEYYEYKVLCERLGDKVLSIIPPIEFEDTYERGLVRGADALSKSYIDNPLIKQYILNDKCTIILFENPPYAESNGTTKISGGFKNSYVVQEMKKEVSGQYSNDLANAFIWSAFKYYLRQPTDSYVVFSTVKYWKIQHLISKRFGGGFAFNRKHFHTNIDACIMAALWYNEDDPTVDELQLQAFNIDNNQLVDEGTIPVKKVYSRFANKFFDKRQFTDDQEGVATTLKGVEATNQKIRVKPKFNTNLVGYLVANGAGFDNPELNSGLTVAGRYDGNGFYLRKDNFLEKLPLYASSRYIAYNRKWTERGRIMKTADGAEAYNRDVQNGQLNQTLLKVLLFTIFDTQNHMRTFIGTDNRFYRNEICLDTTNGSTLASEALMELKLNSKEKEILKLWDLILMQAKQAEEYNEALTYGLYQIIEEINLSYVNEEDVKIYKYPALNGNIASMKTLIKNYYLEEIVPFLFDYEFLK
ncbi:hypothetical protein [Turicibacter sanguinis]|uniref:hypothetical protein n=1 Tax=Turicibacter sanguinis TaxID=154288 RepID=UPI00189E0194|nr:hypothetical protein [Turicibacter sanguinis]